MRVCILTPYFTEYPNAMASAEKMAVALAQDHQVTVITSRTYGAAATEQLGSVTVHRLPAWYIPEPANYVFTRGLVRWLWKQRNNFDVYVINKYMWPIAWTIIWLKLWRKPVIVMTDAFQGYDWWSWSTPVNAVMWLYARTIGWIVLHLANTVVVFHEGLIARAKQLGLNYRVIHNGINPEHFATAQPATDLVKKPGEIIVTYIGRLDKIKGYLDFLAVAQRLQTRYPQVRWLVVGNTHNREAVLAQYQSPHIQFTGVRKDVPNVLASSDLLVLPTYGDGLPNVIMEAMAAGVACIGTNINGLPYLIEHEKTGLLFSPGDQATLERHLRHLIEHPELRQRYGTAGRVKVMAEFNWTILTQQYNELFKQLC